MWTRSGKKRILFLADRNILIDQTMVNDFRPFKGAMAKLSANAKGVEVVDAFGHTTVEGVELAVSKPSSTSTSKSTSATRLTCRCTKR